MHSRRRRVTSPPCERRESITRLSNTPQKGHFIINLCSNLMEARGTSFAVIKIKEATQHGLAVFVVLFFKKVNRPSRLIALAAVLIVRIIDRRKGDLSVDPRKRDRRFIEAHRAT